MSSRHTRATVAIIGAGRLGTALARALAACDYDVRAIVARTRAHARRAAKFIEPQPSLALTALQLTELPPTQILIIATPDDAIASVAEKMCLGSFHCGVRSADCESENQKHRRAERPDTPHSALRTPHSRVAFHASGALSSEVLAPLRACGYSVGSIHPLVSVSEPMAGAENLRGANFCIEGDREALRIARRIVKDFGGESFSIKTEDKPLYHAAAVLTAGHTVALFDVALSLLEVCGIKSSHAQKMMLPLLRSTVNNLSTQTPARALTGTFARGDVATVRKHLTALKRNQTTREAAAIYKLLGLHALKLGGERGVDEKLIREIKKLLKRS